MEQYHRVTVALLAYKVAGSLAANAENDVSPLIDEQSHILPSTAENSSATLPGKDFDRQTDSPRPTQQNNKKAAIARAAFLLRSFSGTLVERAAYVRAYSSPARRQRTPRYSHRGR